MGQLPDVLSNSIVIAAAVVMLVSIYLARASESVLSALGPLGKWLGRRRLRKYERITEFNDARVSVLTEHVDFLLSEVQTIRAEQREQVVLLRQHQKWDNRVARQVRELGGEVEDPPPLYPIRTP